ncbi:MAG: alpha-galactosidase [Phycisphaerae bacterium]|nr:alpha-galactosidase [Phycisphaerae bacterium]
MLPLDCVSVLLAVAWVLACQCAVSYASSKGEGVMTFRPPCEWEVKFNASTSVLDLAHRVSGAKISGKLSFTVRRDKGVQAWSIVAARDSVTSRLALLDDGGNVQGYVTFTGTGDVVRVNVVHRAAQNYRGTLTLDATAQLGKETFACRTKPIDGSSVVQMASGPADSRLNDSLFDIPTDAAVRFAGEHVAIATPPGKGGEQAFTVKMTATIHDAAHNALVFKLIRDYYRARYVPYYKPIDKQRCPLPPTGWMSWNVYFDTAGEKENLDEARVAAKHLKPFGLDIWHIESWQDNSDRLPVSKFHNLTLRPNPRQFPHGMKWLADEIRRLGFRPGIWTVPFGTGDHAFYQAHKDWFLHHPDGKPMTNWNGLYLVDPSQEVVRKHMEDTHRTMSQEWGYEYFKIDGMSGRSQGYSAHFYERPEVRAAFKERCEDPFRLCVEALRRGIGPDRVWLACQGHYSGPEIGQADAGRLGADIVHPNKPPNWHNYRHQVECTLNQLFVNNIVWYGDPDTLLVGQGLPMEMVRLATTIVALPGQLTFFGDKLAELPPERMRLLQQVLPPCDIRPLDLYPIFDMLPVWDLKIRRPFAEWDVVSLFNFSDKPADVAVGIADLGLPADADYLAYDFWNQSFLGSFKQRLAANVPAQGNVLIALHRSLPRPQFLSTDRHITQGGVSLEDLSWDAQKKVLAGKVRLVGGFPSTLVFHVPKGFTLASVKAPGTEVLERRQTGDGPLAIVLRRETSGMTDFTLHF